jgi:hypothetical protein
MLTREQVEGTIRKWYGEGQQFQSREVRQKLEPPIRGDDRDNIARLHNYLKAMEKDKFIQRVPGDQKRNQFYTLIPVEPRRLPAPTHVDATLKESAWNKPQPANAWLIDRLGRIEDMLLAIQQRLNSIENKLDKSLMA